jgi:hypothetical protein
MPAGAGQLVAAAVETTSFCGKKHRTAGAVAPSFRFIALQQDACHQIGARARVSGPTD